jgi:hypothetical protein
MLSEARQSVISVVLDVDDLFRPLGLDLWRPLSLSAFIRFIYQR